MDFSTVRVEVADALGSSQLSQWVAQKAKLLFADKSKQALGEPVSEGEKHSWIRANFPSDF